MAQSGGAQSAQAATPLPTVSVDITKPRRKRAERAATHAAPRVAAPPQPQPQLQAAPRRRRRAAPAPSAMSHAHHHRHRTDTPIINIPQSISVVTQEFIRDQNNQPSLETLRYVPGVIPTGRRQPRRCRHPRAALERGLLRQRHPRRRAVFPRSLQSQRVEVLKGPNAMIFGRGGGGGVINRVLKEADGIAIHEVTVRAASSTSGRVASRSMSARPSTANWSRPPQRHVREIRQLPRLRQSRALRRQSDADVRAQRQPPRSSSATSISTTPHDRPRHPLAVGRAARCRYPYETSPSTSSAIRTSTTRWSTRISGPP